MKKFEFLEKARRIHGYKYSYPSLLDKVTLNDRIEVEYDGKTYIQSISKHLMGRCPEKTVKKKTTDDFILESKMIWNDKYDYSLTEYTGSLNTVKIIYNGVVYEQRASSHLSGLAPEFRNNDESILRDNIYKSDIKGINEIRNFLIKYKFDYEENKYLDNNLFQFYLTDKVIAIEYFGEQHYLIKDVDRKREDYCEDNYINLIRITYEQIDNIYHILYDNLKNYIRK